MKFKYKDIEISKKVELDYKKIKENKKSIVNGSNIKPDKLTKIYDVVDDDIELIPETPEEELLLNDSLVIETTEDAKIIIRTSDPLINSNVRPEGSTQEIIWINSTSGEIFTCIDYTLNANVWVGQRSNKTVVPVGYTLAGIEGNGLVSHFNYDIKDGNKIYSSDNKIYGTLDNCSQSSTAVNGKSFYFKGRGEIKIENKEMFEFNDFTILYHIRPKTLSGNQNHICKGYKNEFSIWHDTYGRIVASYGNGSTYCQEVSNISIDRNVWRHIAVRKVDGVISIFFDGLKDNFSTRIGNPILTPSYSNNHVTIGEGDKGSLKGYIDDTYFFGRGLADAEILKIAEKFKGVV